MKNVTLSIPEDLLEKARSFANEQGTSMNEMIREFLRRTVDVDKSDLKNELLSARSNLSTKTKEKINRDELYER